MTQFFQTILDRHKKFWTRGKLLSLLFGICLFILAQTIHKIIDSYLRSFIGIPVGDLLLDHIPTYSIEWLIVQGSLFVAAAATVLALLKPKYFAPTLKTYALFLVIRAFFVSLTHLGIHPDQASLSMEGPGIWIYNNVFATENDFFFSGHAGAPFLMALIFWKEKIWRYIFFIMSAAMGASVLLAHIHYSIDVFAAPFMAYGIFTIAKKFFASDYKEIETN